MDLEVRERKGTWRSEREGELGGHREKVNLEVREIRWTWWSGREGDLECQGEKVDLEVRERRGKGGVRQEKCTSRRKYI